MIDFTVIKRMMMSEVCSHNRNMKIFPLWMAICMCLTALWGNGCGEKSGSAPKITQADDLNKPEFIIGGETGTVALREARKRLPNAKFKEFSNPGDIYTALTAGKIHAITYDRPSLDYAVLKRNDFVVLPDELAVGRISVGASLKNKELIAKINEFVRQYRGDGTCKNMYQRWVKSKNTQMPEIPAPETPEGTIVIGVECLNEPMGFWDRNGKIAGFDIEFSLRLAKFLNRRCEFKIMNYNALFPACASGKIDLAVAQIDATPERKETMLFSEPYLDSPVALMIRTKDYADGATSVLDALNRPEIRIGLPLGAAAMTAGEKLFGNAKLLYYNSLPEGYLAVQHGKLDAFLFDRHNMAYVVKNNPALKLLPEDIAEEHIVVGFPKHHAKLCAKVNEFIRQFRADGTCREMYRRWCETATPPPMPDIPAPKNPTARFKVGSEGLNEPMNFFGADGKLTGFDIEFIKRLALFLNAEIEVEAMTYSALIPAVETGKIDMLIANLNGTPERKEKMLLSDDYVDSAIAVMVHADYGSPANVGGIHSLRDLKGKKAASLTGSGFQELTEPLQAGIEYLFFNDNNSSVQALRSGKVDAVLLDEPVTRLWAARYPEELRFVGIYAKDHYGFAFKKGSPLTAEASGVIRMLKQSGELEKLIKKWCDSIDSNRKLEAWTHRGNYTGAAGTLRFASDPTQEPMCYFDKGQYIGLDVEIMNRIAYELNMKFEFIPMNFSSLIEALSAGKTDAVGCSMSITEARKKKVDFAESYYDGGLSILAKNHDGNRKYDSIRSIADLKHRRVGTLTNGALKRLADRFVSGVDYSYFNDHANSVQALRSHKIDAVLLDEPVGRCFVAKFPDELQIADVFVDDHYGFALKKGSPLTAEISKIIRGMRERGELKKLADKWCGSDWNAKKQTDWKKQFRATGKNGVLRFAASPVFEPMCYIDKDGLPTGLEIDIVTRIAAELDRTPEFVAVDSNARIEAVSAGKADLAGGSISITEERKKAVDFAVPHYDGGVAVLIRKPKTAAPEEITGYSQLYGKRIGVMTGTSSDRLARDHFPSSEIVYFNAFNDLVIALETGKLEAFLMEEPQWRILRQNRPNLTALKKQISFDDYAFIFSKKEKELCNALSAQIRAMRADGTLKKLEDKWFSGDRSPRQMAPPPANPPNGVLRFATVPQFEPFTFLSNGQVVGYDIEVAGIAAGKLGYALEPVVMEWSGYIEAVQSGKVRLGVSFTTVTEERKQQVLFSEPDYHGGQVVVVKRTEAVKTGPDAGSWLKNTGKELAASFDRTFVREGRWKLILQGLKITILISVLSAIFGTILAFPVCMMRRSKNRFWRMLGRGYISLMQGTPILVILMILYYIVFAKVDIDAVLVAVIGFGLNFAAYVSEMLRTGIEGIPKGQSEAALALGFSRFAVFRNVILPQAVRSILPVYRGEFINVLKTTSIVGYIAIQDLTKMSDIIRSRTYEAFFPLIATAVIYFAAAWLLASGLSLLEYKLDPNNRRSLRKGGVK